MKNKNPNRKKYLDYSSPILEWAKGIGSEKGPFGKLYSFLEEKLGVTRLAFLLVFCLCLAVIGTLDLSGAYNLKLGQIVKSDIKSPFHFSMIDKAATREKMRQAEENVLPLFDYYPEAYKDLFKKLSLAFAEMRDIYSRKDFKSSLYRNKTKFDEALGLEISAESFAFLAKNRFGFDLENNLFRILSYWSGKFIFDGSASQISSDLKSVSVSMLKGEKASWTKIPLGTLVDLRKKRNFEISSIQGLTNYSAPVKKQLKTLATELLVPNLIFNVSKTSLGRKKALEQVQEVKITFERNQPILRAGDVVDLKHAEIFKTIRSTKSGKQYIFKIIATTLLFFSFIWVLLSFSKFFTKNRIQISSKDFSVMATVSFMCLLITKLFLYITESSFYSKFSEILPETFFLYATPLVLGPMLVGLLVTARQAVWLFVIFSAVMTSFVLGLDYSFMLVGLASGLAAVRGVQSCEQRNDVYIAGLKSGFVAAIVLLFVGGIVFIQESKPLYEVFYNMLGAFMGGVISSMFCLTFISVFESLFQITTNVKLLELSNLSHPLMKDMMVKAPGTYHHALSVGNMVEEAANKIGANALLAKVMAYYHDIGKMEHPQYFIENQRPGYNPHDSISPFMSKTIIVAHVKDGAELALKHKLGRAIVDGILQHHGTTLIRYFYEQAKGKSEKNENVNSIDFRYPGPKPQFKEAALVMLADTIEAAARSIAEPTPTKLTNLVRKLIENKFIDGQLNECNLTFKEISLIEETFKKTILNIYHHRIDYPNISNETKKLEGDLVSLQDQRKK